MSAAADEVLLGFTRAVHAAGVPVTADRAHSYLRAVALVGLEDRRATYWAGRATLCAAPEDLVRYDQVFSAWFTADQPGRATPEQARLVVQAGLAGDRSAAAGDEEAEAVPATASRTEVLRQRDIAELNPADRARLAALFAQLRPRPPVRGSHRRGPSHRGQVDAHRTLRRTLARFGEPAEIARRRSVDRDRRVVLLVDVSGSMSPYADALLRLAHTYLARPGRRPGRRARSRPDVEVFTVGTRLTHVTRALRQRDPERALIAAGRTVPDWSGGTRLGETLKVFLDRWGRRGMARGAVVVVFSDGWERGDAHLLGEQMQRLRRLAHRVVWVNPHRGKAGYQPVQQGIVAALPHVDHFVAGHSIDAFTELVEVVSRA